MLPGGRVYRIHWVLGTDRLRAVCHCAAEREFDDPVGLWQWLLAHPAGHEQPQPNRPSRQSAQAFQLRPEIKEEMS